MSEWFSEGPAEDRDTRSGVDRQARIAKSGERHLNTTAGRIAGWILGHLGHRDMTSSQSHSWLVEVLALE